MKAPARSTPRRSTSRLERKAIELSFRAGRDYLRGTLRTLKENRDEAFDYLRLALDRAALRRRRRSSASARRSCRGCSARPRARTTSPAATGGRRPSPATPMAGRSTARSNRCRSITVDDLKSYTRRVLARDNLKIAVVGDIDAETAGMLLDRTFGALPAKAELDAGRRLPFRRGSAAASSIELDVPQAVVNFGGPGIRPQRSRLHGRLYRQPHPRRRLVLLAALSRGAREARPGLRHLRQPGLAQSRRAAARRHRDPRRRHRPDHRDHRAGDSPAGARKDRPRRSSSRRRPISRARSRSASTPRTGSRASSCRCSSTISASTTSSAAPP